MSPVRIVKSLALGALMALALVAIGLVGFLVMHMNLFLGAAVEILLFGGLSYKVFFDYRDLQKLKANAE